MNFSSTHRILTRAGWLTATTAITVARLELELRTSRTPHAVLHETKKRYGHTLLKQLGVAPKISELHPSDPTRGRLVVCNHRSVIDIAILLGHFGGRVLARGDLEHWPVLGWLAARGETIFVDRQSKKSGAVAIRKIRRCLANQQTVFVFPEGTTFPGDEVRPFRFGAFAAAKKLDVDIVPVGIAYPEGSEYVNIGLGEHLRSVLARRRTPCVVHIGKAFQASTNPRDDAVRAQMEVQALVHSARTQFDSNNWNCNS